MVHQFHHPSKNIIAHDVIILGCSLSGMVAAHNLKERFGDAVDVLLIDLVRPSAPVSHPTVGFIVEKSPEDEEAEQPPGPSQTIKQFLIKYTTEFKIPIPDAIIDPQKCQSAYNKLFQYIDGKFVPCRTNYHDFGYLGWLEQFELNQFQTLLDENMKMLFQSGKSDTLERNVLHSWDQTTMEKYICDCLIFSTPREIMRLTVKLICGAPAYEVSVLFYLYQCNRNRSSRNCLDGDNVRIREKLLGYCRKKVSAKLLQSVKDITKKIKRITEIRSYSEEQVILETCKGDTDFVCNLLAMALPPDDLRSITINCDLISPEDNELVDAMLHGQSRKFVVQYVDNFWRQYGYSGDILSIRGPIIWAMEKPKLATTGSAEKYATLIGYLKIENSETDSKEAVLDQLVKLFGEEAASPVHYHETLLRDIFVPRCGDYVALTSLTKKKNPKLDWAPLDVYADGDLAASLEAGHIAYLNLLRCIRPQAITFEDARMSEPPTVLPRQPFTRWGAHLNITSGLYCAMASAMLIAGYKLLRHHWK